MTRPRLQLFALPLIGALLPVPVAFPADNEIVELTYLSIRLDPDHVLPAGYVHPALRK